MIGKQLGRYNNETSAFTTRLPIAHGVFKVRGLSPEALAEDGPKSGFVSRVQALVAM